MKLPTSATLSWYQIPQVIVFTLLLLYIGKPFFIPMGFAVLLSFILFPICKWFETKKVPRTWAITLSFLVVSSVLLLLLLVVLYQLNKVGDKLPALFDKLLSLFAQIQQFIAQKTPISLEQQMLWLQQSAQELAKYVGSSLKGTIAVTIDLFIFIVLVPFMSILLLFNREKFLAFLQHLLPKEQHENILPVLHSSITTFYGYIKGLLVVYIIVALLNSIGLWLLGLENAIFYGVLTAILTIIPYFGI
ncbi:MAG: AI-2E family transporter, partial [Thermoflexibacteraceae bacterium]